MTKPLFWSPTGGPTLGPVPGSEFGNDRGDHPHGGVDLNCMRRYPLKNGRAGIVTLTGRSTGLGGNKCEVSSSIFGDVHLLKHYHFGDKSEPWQTCILVRVGDYVTKDTILGYAGDSGNATAVHDHYEHYVNGVQKDPLQYLREYQVLKTKRLALAYPGSIGPDIPLMQERLTVHGLSPGSVDGVWGPNTTRSLKRFQALQDLNPDGILGRKTWQALLRQP